MQSLELSAKSVEEAKQMAAERLGVAASQVQVTVLEETKGLFGKMHLKVRADVAAEPEAKAAPKGRGSRAPKEPIKETPAEIIQDIQETTQPKAEDQKPERRTRSNSRESDTGRRGARKTDAGEATAPSADRDAPSEAQQASQEDADLILNELLELLGAANMQVTANIRELSGRYVNIQLDGKDAAFLVGKHGEVLNALQYLLNIIVQRQLPSGARATLDANDYRRRREDALTKLATRIAEQVLDRQEEAVLDALPAFERRIVHKALSTITGVQTYSEGEEPNRRVVIAPAE
jgi:spoIIIJ-associated protein